MSGYGACMHLKYPIQPKCSPHRLSGALSVSYRECSGRLSPCRYIYAIECSLGEESEIG